MAHENGTNIINIEAPLRKKLKRDLDREALIRLEQAARTEDDFKKVEVQWDRLDANRERRERRREQLIFNDMFDWDFEDFVRYEEDFLSLSYFCICQMHLLTQYSEVSELMDKATDKQKEAFFMRFLLARPTEHIANWYGTSDRNVRKHIQKMVENIRRELYPLPDRKDKAKAAMTLWEREFLDKYIDEYGEKEGKENPPVDNQVGG